MAKLCCIVPYICMYSIVNLHIYIVKGVRRGGGGGGGGGFGQTPLGSELFFLIPAQDKYVTSSEG